MRHRYTTFEKFSIAFLMIATPLQAIWNQDGFQMLVASWLTVIFMRVDSQ
jgi:hypothetical protein